VGDPRWTRQDGSICSTCRAPHTGIPSRICRGSWIILEGPFLVTINLLFIVRVASYKISCGAAALPQLYRRPVDTLVTLYRTTRSR
jgi:hypothetical protein